MHYWFKSYGDFAEWVIFLLDKGVKLVSGGSVINGAYPVCFFLNIKSDLGTGLDRIKSNGIVTVVQG